MSDICIKGTRLKERGMHKHLKKSAVLLMKEKQPRMNQEMALTFPQLYKLYIKN